VISGPTKQIDELIARVRAKDRFASRVNIEVAPHNPAMDALQPAMRSELADLSPRTPTIPIISTTYENLYTRPVFDAEHWPPTCATRCASSRPSSRPAPSVTPSSKSAPTRC